MIMLSNRKGQSMKEKEIKGVLYTKHDELDFFDADA
jgi:hypothetical protein